MDPAALGVGETEPRRGELVLGVSAGGRSMGCVKMAPPSSTGKFGLTFPFSADLSIAKESVLVFYRTNCYKHTKPKHDLCQWQ